MSSLFDKKIINFCAPFVHDPLAYLSHAIFVLLQNTNPNLMDLKQIGWIPLITIILTNVMICIGVRPVLEMLASELYPTEIRTQSMGITRAIQMFLGAETVI